MNNGTGTNRNEQDPQEETAEDFDPEWDSQWDEEPVGQITHPDEMADYDEIED